MNYQRNTNVNTKQKKTNKIQKYTKIHQNTQKAH